MDYLSALLRGGAAALVVVALLLAAQRWGRGLAGLLAGLPTVTGPAMVWLALDRGSDFAEQASHGAIAAAVPCALFGLIYARLSLTCGRLATLLWACAACLSALSLLSHWSAPMHLTLALVAVTCAVCLASMPRVLPRALQHPVGPRRHAMVLRAGVMTVLTAGVVTALASLSAQALGPQWAGVMTSLPLLAAAVVLVLHREGCAVQVQDFLRGYTAGLVGRSVFVAVFGALLATRGLALALATALAVALTLGWGTLAWMQWRGRLAILWGTNR